MARKKAKQAHDSSEGIRPSELEVPEEEQRRLIDESDLFTRIASRQEQQSLEEKLTLGDEIFNATTLIIPFTSLLVLMDILVHQQYSQEPSVYRELERLVEVMPFLCLFIFYTNRYRTNRWCQAFMSLTSIASGTRLVYVVNKESFLRVMRQSPPLGTLWVYSIWQLDLLPAVLSLAVAFGWVWWRSLKIIF